MQVHERSKVNELVEVDEPPQHLEGDLTRIKLEITSRIE